MCGRSSNTQFILVFASKLRPSVSPVLCFSLSLSVIIVYFVGGLEILCSDSMIEFFVDCLSFLWRVCCKYFRFAHCMHEIDIILLFYTLVLLTYWNAFTNANAMRIFRCTQFDYGLYVNELDQIHDRDSFIMEFIWSFSMNLGILTLNLICFVKCVGRDSMNPGKMSKSSIFQHHTLIWSSCGHELCLYQSKKAFFNCFDDLRPLRFKEQKQIMKMKQNSWTSMVFSCLQISPYSDDDDVCRKTPINKKHYPKIVKAWETKRAHIADLPSKMKLSESHTKSSTKKMWITKYYQNSMQFTFWWTACDAIFFDEYSMCCIQVSVVVDFALYVACFHQCFCNVFFSRSSTFCLFCPSHHFFLSIV